MLVSAQAVSQPEINITVADSRSSTVTQSMESPAAERIRLKYSTRSKFGSQPPQYFNTTLFFMTWRFRGTSPTRTPRPAHPHTHGKPSDCEPNIYYDTTRVQNCMCSFLSDDIASSAVFELWSLTSLKTRSGYPHDPNDIFSTIRWDGILISPRTIKQSCDLHQYRSRIRS